MIKRNSSTPLYVQLADLLRKKIATGEIKIGDKLPSESEMIKEYNLGRLTVRDALSILANEGLIEKHHGKGTFCKAEYNAPKYRIDVILNLKDMYFVHHYLHAICGEFEESDVSVVLHDSKDCDNTIASHLEKILSIGTSGIILEPSSYADKASKELTDILNKLVQNNVPYIMIDKIYSNFETSYVIMNEVESGRIAANYFKTLGHKKLCMITNEKNSDSYLRLKGFKEELKNEPAIINYSNNLKDDIKNLLETQKDVTGIFCYNDSVAKDLVKSLQKLKVKVPDDISVMSVDDTVIASALSLTSVVHQKENLGKTAAKALMDIILKSKKWPYKKIFEPSINIRKSCKQI